MSVMNSNPSSPLLSGAGKIQGIHLDRVAIVYVRQSTLQQIERHRESTRLQYALVERAIALGWAKQRVVVIDEDLGCSGATARLKHRVTSTYATKAMGCPVRLSNRPE